jgi:hypothetical protein
MVEPIDVRANIDKDSWDFKSSAHFHSWIPFSDVIIIHFFKMAPTSASKGRGTVYAPVQAHHLDEEEDVFDEEWIDPLEIRKAEERKKLWKTVFWVQAANFLLLSFLYAVWLMANKDDNAYNGGFLRLSREY